MTKINALTKMNLNKLLNKQLIKYLPEAYLEDENLTRFIEAVNQSYHSFEKDKELTDHAFLITDRDYKEITGRLNNEIKLRNETIYRLKEAVKNIQDDEPILFTDKEDDLLGIVLYLNNQITKRKETEKELLAAKEAAEASTVAKESFLANMSHEIRTPMNAIFGMANQLAKTPLNEKQHFYLNTIHTAADNLLVIINDILDLSKVESGKLNLEKIGFNLKDIIERVMQVMLHRAEEKGLVFSHSFFDKSLAPVLLGDPYRLNQVVLNLVSNAIKFTDKGKVDICCKLIAEDADKQKILITISDTGIGMDEIFTKNLFRKFTQEDNSIIRKYGGTGLGMSICKELVDLMKGDISVSSEKGKGTEINIVLEFEKGRLADLPVKEKTIIDTQILKGKNILLADDNEMNRLVASTILSNYEVTVTEAVNGADAIEKLKQQQFDLILMDVQMPVMDGLEAVKIIRTTVNSEIPIIALTALAIKGDNQKCIDAGMNDYLSKPFEESQLIEMITGWLYKSNPLPGNDKPGSEEAALFNLRTINNFSKNNPSFVEKMINIFIDQAALTVSELKKAQANNNFESINKVAHRFKPSIDNLEITALKSNVRELEVVSAATSTPEKILSLIDYFEKVINNVVEQLEKRQQ